MVKESSDGFTALPLQITQVRGASLLCLKSYKSFTPTRSALK